MNLVLFIVDDLRPWLGAYNVSWIHTPHIDALASEGTVFTRAFANQAVCGPSRTSFLTGRRPDTTQLYDFGSYWRDASGNFTTLPQYFREHGYETRSVGKVFHPISAMKKTGHADDVPFSWSAAPYHPPTQKFKDAAVCNNSDSDPTLSDDGQLHDNIVCPIDDAASQPGGSLPDMESATEAIRLLREELGPGTKPFLLACGFHKPHVPLKFPRSYMDAYPSMDSVPLPEAAARVKPEGMPPVAWDTWDDVRSREDVAALHVPWPYGPMPTNMTKLVRRAYASAVTYMDAEVGAVLGALEEAGLGQSTAVVLLGDHGWQLSERGEFAKYSNAEAATHVLIVRLPQTSWRATAEGGNEAGAVYRSST
jgi:iduronate 2-sulfatase